jgi:hypothetical protein
MPCRDEQEHELAHLVGQHLFCWQMVLPAAASPRCCRQDGTTATKALATAAVGLPQPQDTGVRKTEVTKQDLTCRSAVA